MPFLDLNWVNLEVAIAKNNGCTNEKDMTSCSRTRFQFGTLSSAWIYWFITSWRGIWDYALQYNSDGSWNQKILLCVNLEQSEILVRRIGNKWILLAFKSTSTFLKVRNRNDNALHVNTWKACTLLFQVTDILYRTTSHVIHCWILFQLFKIRSCVLDIIVGGTSRLCIAST